MLDKTIFFAFTRYAEGKFGLERVVRARTGVEIHPREVVGKGEAAGFLRLYEVGKRLAAIDPAIGAGNVLTRVGRIDYNFVVICNRRLF